MIVTGKQQNKHLFKTAYSELGTQYAAFFVIGLLEE